MNDHADSVEEAADQPVSSIKWTNTVKNSVDVVQTLMCEVQASPPLKLVNPVSTLDQLQPVHHLHLVQRIDDSRTMHLHLRLLIPVSRVQEL